MNNCKLFFCFLLLGAWACAEEDVEDVVKVFEDNAEALNIEPVPRLCFTNTITPVSCDGVGEDRLMPHPDDCRMFYHCAEMWPQCKECPDGLHFNPELHVCDYPERAGCELPCP